jgi:hypothetical protein
MFLYLDVSIFVFLRQLFYYVIVNSNIILYKMFNTKIVILILFSIIIIIMTYKLYNNDIHNYGGKHNNNHNTIEHFGSILSKLNKNNKNDTKNNKTNKNNYKSNKSITFDELISNSEKFAKEKDNLESITDALAKYKKIFKSNKFKNNSQSTAESFEKFGFYKEKLFELFK